VKVPDEQERGMMRKAVELRASGWSFDKIRQYLTYTMKARTRGGGETQIRYLQERKSRL
jgi:hypothetical protein